MAADSGTTGSTHSSQVSKPVPVGAEEPTVVRGPDAFANQSTVSPDFSATPAEQKPVITPTLRRLFDNEQNVFGIRLGEFVLEELLGTGGMGAVFRAHDARLGRKVALKVLSPKATLDSQLVSRFHNEARAAARLSHDNISRVYSSGDDLGVHYIAYELIDGTNLRDLIAERGTVAPSEAVSYAIQIGMALNHTAAAGVVHRDIKPSNIIITPEGRARVVDLGLARRDTEDSIADLTVAGATLGTFDYISPEQAQNPSNVDVRSDIYSLGCTIFHMLTGQAPYPDGTALQKLLDHKGKDAPAPIEVNRKVPRDLSNVVHQTMASDPDDRHATPALLVEDLMRIAARLGLRGIQPEGLVWKSAGETRAPLLDGNLAWIAIATLLVLGAFLLRLNPHVVETNWRAGQLRVRKLEPNENQAADTKTVDSNRALAASNAVADTPGPGEDAVSSEPSTPFTGMQFLDSLFDMATSLRDGFSKGIEQQPPVADTSKPSSTAKTMTSTTPVPQISLQSDPQTSFTTLQAACWAAKDGDVIVIRPDTDSNPLVEKPLRIVRKNITIRGETEFGRVPLIRFDVGPDPADVESHMMTVVGGAVRVSNLDIQVVTRDDVGADRWSLFAIEGAERVRLDNVNIDLPNPDNLEASVFEITLGDDAAMARMQNAAGEYVIRLTGGCIRGNCQLFRSRSALPGSLQLTNTAVLISQSLLYVAGMNEVLLDRERIDLELTHTTCVLGNGLIRMSNIDGVEGAAQELVPVEVVSENNIFATANDVPLVRMEGTSAPEEFQLLLSWAGQKNLYDGFKILWQRDSSLSALGVYEDDYDDWARYWKANPDTGEVGAMTDTDPWRSDRWRSQKLLLLQPDDFEIDPASQATSGSTDGTNLGADLSAVRRLVVDQRE